MIGKQVSGPYRLRAGPLTIAELADAWTSERHALLRRQVQGMLGIRQVSSCLLEADDVIQSAWVVLLQKKEDQVQDAGGYLFGVIKRLVLTAERAHKGCVWVPADALDERGIVRSAELEFLEKEAAEELLAVREELTFHERIVIHALIDLGLPYRAIADHLGISVGAVSSHRARALAKLGKHEVVMRIDEDGFWQLPCDSWLVEPVSPDPLEWYTPAGRNRWTAYHHECVAYREACERRWQCRQRRVRVVMAVLRALLRTSGGLLGCLLRVAIMLFKVVWRSLRWLVRLLVRRRHRRQVKRTSGTAALSCCGRGRCLGPGRGSRGSSRGRSNCGMRR